MGCSRADGNHILAHDAKISRAVPPGSLLGRVYVLARERERELHKKYGIPTKTDSSTIFSSFRRPLPAAHIHLIKRCYAYHSCSAVARCWQFLLANMVNAQETNGTTNGHTNGYSGQQTARQRIVVAMTGATGAILGIKLLIALRRLNVETHLVLSHWAEATIRYETDYTPAAVRALADHSYSNRDQAAPISSGSFRADGMIVVPCSMKTLAAINAGYCDDLISRAADVVIKERRRLVLNVRETPLSEIHLRNMLGVTHAGAIICPTVPAFYTKPESIEQLVEQMVGRTLDLFGFDTKDFPRWSGYEKD